MKRIAKYVLNYKVLFTIPLVAMLTFIALDLIQPYIIGIIIDDVIEGGDMILLNSLILALLGITIGKAIFIYVSEYLFEVAGAKTSIDIREDLFNHVQKLPFNYFDGTSTGEIMSRTTEDVNKIWMGLGFIIRFMVENIVYFTLASVMLFRYNWQLAIFTLAVMPIMGKVAFTFEKKIGKTFEKISDQNAKLNTAAQENLAGIRLVKAFARERYEVEKFLTENDKYYRYNLEHANVLSKYNPILEFLSNFTLVIVVTVGGNFVIGEQMSTGDLVAFNGYAMMLVWPLRLMGWLTNVLAECQASAKKIFKIMDTQPNITSPKNSENPNEFRGHVIFENVSFKHKGKYILKNISINAHPGSTVAIMGTTGSGKSSIINLIGRFYDCTQGTIKVDGVDVKRMNLNLLRSNIAVVMQDTFLFSDTLRNNISFGVETSTEEEFYKACQDAMVTEFVDDMQAGFETVVGERGVGLSGGQKQRVAIARALLKESKILILDDATSALDMETEFNIQRSVENRKEMTKFIIAHRISAVKNADEILLIEDGKVIERGNHANLLHKKGKYYEIYKEQFKDLDAQKQEVV
ncbi:ABC transporter ATP-binding protein [Proteinivorax hydrogeniformans]|uniref:ABC transporter ATP-binding protein n=1 Tax=Proteinivorax hydrogeniformans TaxID=1826727 RepID=A0AAU8HR78_9FIRM